MSDSGSRNPLGQSDTTDGARGPVGAVMVVGGGIAGMQASLDLAEQGFKVFLVETKSAIGGHMAKLDKTFPTNDCAMCAISPKLVETSGHLNIEILTDTEVLGVTGDAGRFTARLRRKARYIDIDKCVSCGECERVCPVSVPDEFNERLAPRRAAHRLYPQAIPAAFAIEKTGVAPCRDACPAGQRAQGYIAHIRAGRYAEALRVIKEDNPFPGICGRICHHPCEIACNRGQLDEPVNIRGLKRFVSDWANAQPRSGVERLEQTRAEKVAVIGAGPCGLTAAKDLVTLGYGVTVFEALPVAGGMLRVGVPEYRLPTAIVDREVQDIVDLGVELRLNTTVKDLDALFAQGFNAVLIAVGAHDGRKLPIPGADLPDVLINTRFLRDARLAELPAPEGETPGTQSVARVRGKRVLVLGGGNVAIDCARTALRLGAASVAMACLESREKMPAYAHEIQEAEEEGVALYPARSFRRVVGDGGRVTGVECEDVTSMAFDSQGKLALETAPNSAHVLPCDAVIFSVGQDAGLGFIPEKAGVTVTPRATVGVDQKTFAATRPGVFAAGDVTTGTAFVIEAVAAGHQVATSIDQYLRGAALEPRAKPATPVATMSQQQIAAKLARGTIRRAPRAALPMATLNERRSGFTEVERGFTEEQAKAEASRCFDCGVCSECLSCVYACDVKAINLDEVERVDEIEIGAVILAPGYQPYNAELSQEFGFGRFPNVVTSLQFERLLSASGPTGGHVRRPSDGVIPKKIAFLQCIGSRDQKHDYCSAVCCMYAAKEAIMAKEHEPDTEVHVFMMDMRAFSKNYEEYYQRARQKYGVQYHRCRISSVAEDPRTRKLTLRYMKEGYADAAGPAARLAEEEFDLVVLSVGMEISPRVQQLGRDLGVELDAYGFCSTVRFDPLQTSRPGIYAVGPFREPKDIPETVVEASAAAGQVSGLLSRVRGALAREQVYPPERDVSAEPPRVGVFVCHCGTNIAGYVDVKNVAGFSKELPGVVHSEDMLYACSRDSVAAMIDRAKQLRLNRVVVAACTPRTHEPLFQHALREAELNPYLLEMANIRNQCSWVHSKDRPAATRKAKDLVRMSVARVGGLEPLQTVDVGLERAALVIGGGLAGMTAALSLAEQGFTVHLIERDTQLGGNLRHVHYLSEPVTGPGTTPRAPLDPQAFLRDTIDRVLRDRRIAVFLRAELVETSGFVGNFVSRLGDGRQLRHGVTIVATGGKEYRGSEYGYGSDPRILTQQQFEGVLAAPGEREALPQSVVMIQCVGPSDKYCGRLCCSTAIKNAVRLKAVNPAADVLILYKDIRTYGFKERVYAEARRSGVRFLRFDDEHQPSVEMARAEAGPAPIIVRAMDPVLGTEIRLQPDVLVLSTPMTPADGARELGSVLKVPLDADGWFLEAHVKLRPVDFASEGIFVAGAGLYPKLLDETIVQARAAASRAANILTRKALKAGGAVATVATDKCTGCLTCVRVCPFGVPKIKAELLGVGGLQGAAYIEPAICQGCGICASECPAKAINVMHYLDGQVKSKVSALFEGEPA